MINKFVLLLYTIRKPFANLKTAIVITFTFAIRTSLVSVIIITYSFILPHATVMKLTCLWAMYSPYLCMLPFLIPEDKILGIPCIQGFLFNGLCALTKLRLPLFDVPIVIRTLLVSVPFNKFLFLPHSIITEIN